MKQNFFLFDFTKALLDFHYIISIGNIVTQWHLIWRRFAASLPSSSWSWGVSWRCRCSTTRQRSWAWRWSQRGKTCTTLSMSMTPFTLVVNKLERFSALIRSNLVTKCVCWWCLYKFANRENWLIRIQSDAHNVKLTNGSSNEFSRYSISIDELKQNRNSIVLS